MNILYQNSRAQRVRFLQVALWAFALGVPALLAPQARAGDADAWILMASMTPILVLLALGMEYYLRSYVVRLTELPEGLKLDTLSTFGQRSCLVAWNDLAVGRHLHDRVFGGAAPSVDNTSILLRLSTRRLPMIVDTTRDALNIKLLQRRIRKSRATA